MIGVDGLAVVIYTDDTFAERHGTPNLELWRAIDKRLRGSGLTLKDACCVASDGWVSYLEPRRPVGGRPLTEITESRMALEAAYLVEELPDVSEWNELPDADPTLADQVREDAYDLLDFGGRYDSFGVFHDVELDPVELGERVLATRASELRMRTLAELVAVAHVPATRDALLLTLAGGRELGEHTMVAQRAAIARRDATGESFDEQALAALAEKEPDDDDLVLLGRSRERPDGDRLVRAIHVLRRAAAHAPWDLRSGILCMLVWMLWARGSMAAATRMHELAARSQPRLLMVETLGWLLSSGYPKWGPRGITHDVHN